MTTNKANSIDPTLEDPVGMPLPNGEISVSKNHSYVVFRVYTGKLPPDTTITASFKVIEPSEWSETKPSEQPSTTFQVQRSLYSSHAGKTATLRYTTSNGESGSLHADIVA
ncbi:hypothetical protein [Pseudomonas sp. KCJK9016]|uniref:hypothetical protein n=1 Tax=Pseudomonas sp. KCJK9016 TaxID=3344556 RepID=UPI003905AD2A